MATSRAAGCLLFLVFLASPAVARPGWDCTFEGAGSEPARTISHLDIADMTEQVARRSERLELPRSPQACGALAVTSGDGMEALFESLGVTVLDGVTGQHRAGQGEVGCRRSDFRCLGHVAPSAGGYPRNVAGPPPRCGDGPA